MQVRIRTSEAFGRRATLGAGEGQVGRNLLIQGVGDGEPGGHPDQARAARPYGPTTAASPCVQRMWSC